MSQVVRVTKLSGPERPLEVFYFVEGTGGERIPAEVTAATLNRLDLQRAAIVLGHRVQRPLAQRESTPRITWSQTLNQSPNVSPLPYLPFTAISPVSHSVSLSQLYLTCMSRCLTCLQLWKLCPSPRQRLRAAVSGWLLESSSPSCWLSSSSSSFTGSCAVQRSWSSSQMPSTQSSRDRRLEVNRKFITLSCSIRNH